MKLGAASSRSSAAVSTVFRGRSSGSATGTGNSASSGPSSRVPLYRFVFSRTHPSFEERVWSPETAQDNLNLPSPVPPPKQIVNCKTHPIFFKPCEAAKKVVELWNAGTACDDVALLKHVGELCGEISRGRVMPPAPSSASLSAASGSGSSEPAQPGAADTWLHFDSWAQWEAEKASDAFGYAKLHYKHEEAAILARGLFLPVVCKGSRSGEEALIAFVSGTGAMTWSLTHRDKTSSVLFLLTGRKIFWIAHKDINVDGYTYPKNPDWQHWLLYNPFKKSDSENVSRGWFKIEMNKGDALIIPEMWWHCVESTPGSIGLSFELSNEPVNLPDPEVGRKEKKRTLVTLPSSPRDVVEVRGGGEEKDFADDALTFASVDEIIEACDRHHTVLRKRYKQTKRTKSALILVCVNAGCSFRASFGCATKDRIPLKDAIFKRAVSKVDNLCHSCSDQKRVSSKVLPACVHNIFLSVGVARFNEMSGEDVCAAVASDLSVHVSAIEMRGLFRAMKKVRAGRFAL